MLRAAIKAGTETGLEAKAFMDKGELVPDNVILRIVSERLAQGAPEDQYMFDGRVTNGFQFEIAEVARCVAAGQLESERMRWEDSRAVMRVLDEARRQVGVRYPGEA